LGRAVVPQFERSAVEDGLELPFRSVLCLESIQNPDYIRAMFINSQETPVTTPVEAMTLVAILANSTSFCRLSAGNRRVNVAWYGRKNNRTTAMRGERAKKDATAHNRSVA
jgi:hypothetical protein